jgi:hypothetical protein
MQLKKNIGVKIAASVARVSSVSHPFIYFKKHYNERRNF